MVITDKQKEQLEQFLPNYKEILQSGSFLDLLDELALESVASFVNGNPSKRSGEIDCLYYALYNQNKK